MHLRERKKSFIKIPTLILYLKLQTLFFWQIWHYGVKGTGWVGLELSIIFTPTKERFHI